MKKLLSIGTLVLFLTAMSFPVLAQDPPKDSVKTTKSECSMKKGDKKCSKTCDHKDCKKKCDNAEKSSCCKKSK